MAREGARGARQAGRLGTAAVSPGSHEPIGSIHGEIPLLKLRDETDCYRNWFLMWKLIDLCLWLSKNIK